MHLKKIVMRRPLLLAVLLALLPVSRPVAAAPSDPVADLASLRAEVQKLDSTVAPFVEKRRRLDGEAAKLAAQIDAEKHKPAGVRRDLDLQALLAASKTKTDELDRVQAELRWREPGLVELRRRLVRAIDNTLDRDAASKSLSESARLELERVRTTNVALLVSPATPLQIARDAQYSGIDLLDGPRELRYKADLLRDSGDKLRREAQRIATRIDSVERRRHLRERAGALDEDMFGEATSNRRIARTQGTLTAANNNGKAAGETTPTRDPNQATDSASGGAAPAVPGMTPNAGGTTGGATGLTGSPGGNANNNGSNSGGGNSGGSFSNTTPTRSTESTVLRNLVDPATLDELRRADAIDDVDRQTRALKKAQGELETLAKELDRRAKALEGRAAELRNQK